jgi:hypothetical protein
MSEATYSLSEQRDYGARNLLRSAGPARIWRLTEALFQRGLRERGTRLFLFPLGGAVILLLESLLILWIPQVTTLLTRYGLEQAQKLYFGNIQGNLGLSMAFLLIQGPFLMAFFSAFNGATTALSSVGTEASRGSLEVLLGQAYKRSELFLAFLFSSFLLTLIGWLALACSTLGVGTITLLLLHATFHLSAGYLVEVLFLPLPLAFWANLLVLTLGLAFPRLVQIRTGSSTNLLQLLASLPALALFVLIILRPDLDLNLVILGALGISVIGSVFSIVLLHFHFRPQYLLES